MKTKTSSLATGISGSKMTITKILSIALAVSGIHHGFFEILQGNTPTPGLFIDSIGELHRMWQYGNDGAFTLIPNFLVTGIFAIAFSAAIIIWALLFIHHRHGVTVLFLLFIALTLTGGGIGHIPFFLLIWVFARKKNARFTFWEKRYPQKIKDALSKTWMSATWLSGIFFIIGLEISVFGYVPIITDPERILAVCWWFLFASLILLNYSYLAAFAREYKQN